MVVCLGGEDTKEMRGWLGRAFQGSCGPLSKDDAPANYAMRRSVPTSSTSRSRSSTVFTPFAAHV